MPGSFVIFRRHSDFVRQAGLSSIFTFNLFLFYIKVNTLATIAEPLKVFFTALLFAVLNSRRGNI